MIIYGAGMAGLLAANMLRRYRPVIHESQASLSNNHEALLRFRTDAVSRATGIPFRKVEVTKAIHYKDQLLSHPTIQTNNLYSLKVTNEYRSHSISDLRPVERWVAPANFIEQMSQSCNIEFGSDSLAHKISSGELVDGREHKSIISTVPMPVLMDLVGWPNPPRFSFKTIWSVRTEIEFPDVDLYQTIYFPDPDVPYYRVSITGKHVILEFNKHPDTWVSGSDVYLRTLLGRCFGIIDFESPPILSIKEQKYGKLLPVDDMERRRFILAMTDNYRLYSVGRFATWRQILMDDVVHDVQMVERWITERSVYTRRIQGGNLL